MPRTRLPLWIKMVAASLFALLVCLATEMVIARRTGVLLGWPTVLRAIFAAVGGGFAYFIRPSAKVDGRNSSTS